MAAETLRFLIASNLIWLIGAMLLVGLLFAVAGSGRRRKRDYPYQRRATLVTPAERRFLAVLDAACGPHYRVFAQVRVCDVLRVAPGLDASTHTTALNRITSKHVDFVVVRRDNLDIAFCLELDDRSHRQASRQSRDAFLNAAFEAAGMPLLRVPCRESYDVAQLRAMIKEAVAGR